ncbi:18447_t:CDS:2 [Funneliformis geosporum]|nr:18447_t:CDS:2 [Funneliformis geosporum]
MSSTSLSRSDSGSSKYSTPPQTPSTTPPPFIMCTDFLPNLSKDLSILLSDNEDYNMIINVGEQPNIKQFKVHSIILRVRSPYFRVALSSEWAKIENNYITFNKPNISPKVFEVILKYIYTGTIILDEDINTNTSTILELMIAADELCLQEIIDYAQSYLLLYKPGWIQRNFATTNWSEWTSKAYEILSEKVERCLPSIRFLHISSGDFYKRIKPFAPIIPVELYEDILQYHLVPEHQPSEILIQPKRVTIDSVIIERKHAALIANWIDGKDCEKEKENCLNNPYEFKLLLRGSRDGFTGSEFHQKCNSKCATVTIMKISNTGELIGGFTPISWLSQNSWGYTNESFIFSLRENSVVSRVKDPSRAINHYKNYGPSFGGNDLKMAGNFKIDTKCHCRQEDYEYPIRNDTDSFNIDEYEVFQIIPRRPDLMNL